MTNQFFKKNDRKHLMLIDGNSLINRAFYAGGGRTILTAPDGTPSGAVYTFLNMLLSYQEKIQPDGIIVAFDLKDKTFRHKMYDEYKATRKGMPDDLAMQMPLLKEMLDALNISRVEKAGYEADDLIGSYAKTASSEGYDVYIVTGDKDSYQLIRDHVFVVSPITSLGSTTENLMDRQAFRDEYKFDPELFVDYKAIMGDSADNIPGIKGIGKVGAADLITSHGSLQEIYDELKDNPENIAKKYHKKLEEGKERAELSYKLSLIETDLPLEIDQKDIIVKEPDNQELSDFFAKMGFQTMFERFSLVNVDSIINKEDLDQLTEHKDLDQFLSETGQESLVWNLLSTSESLLFSKSAGYILLERIQVQTEKNKLFNLNNNIIVWDYKNWLHKINLGKLKIQPFDVQIAAYLLDQGKAKDFASVFQSVFKQNFLTLKKKDSKEKILEYAKKQAWAMLMLHNIQRDLIRDNKMEYLAYAIEMPLTPILAKMEQKGIMADKKQFDLLHKTMSQEILELEKEIFKYSDSEFNINSSQQLSDVLFNQLKLKPGKKLASGYYSTAVGELERLQGDHPIIDYILEHREVSKLNSTFVDGLRKTIDAKDGRIHTTYHQTLTSTGRLSSSDPNLQNIPIRSERSKVIREVFVAKANHILLGADYSQIELRLLAHLSEDENLLAAFKNNFDIHKNTAMKMFDKAAEDITSEERSLAKTVNFSIIYGVTPYGLSQDLKSSVEEAKNYITTYYEHYDQVKPYLDSLIEQAKEKGYVETIFGRRRYIPELKSSQFFTRSFGERAAMNAPLQGTAADLIKLAMIKIDALLEENDLQAKLILQVHDELILEVPEEEADTVSDILKTSMENVAKLKVNLLAEVVRGKSWADL